jgi:hypothetical protein
MLVLITYWENSIGRGRVSGGNVASSPLSGAAGEIKRSNPFNFKSIYFTAWDGSGLANFRIEGFRGSTLRFSQDINTLNGSTAPLTTPTLVNFDWDGIDRLNFTFSSGGISMDNFTFDEPTATSTSVPTPAVLPALIGMGVGLWRKRKATVLAEESAESTVGSLP